MGIAKTNDKFPPEQIKEKLGALSVAMAKSTAPENKLSLCSSRISTLIGILDYKCREWAEPGLLTLLYQTVAEMVRDMQAENMDPERYSPLLDETFHNLQKYLNDRTTYNIESKIKFVPAEGIELLKDYNLLLNCRARWKEAHDAYMKNKDSWGISNKALADLSDVLETIEMKYNLVVMPKNYSYNIGDLNLLKPEAT